MSQGIVEEAGQLVVARGVRVVSKGGNGELAVQWVREIQQVVVENLGDDQDEPNDLDGGVWEAIDDVNGGCLPVGLVKEARWEEVEYINTRGIWVFRP